MAHKILIVDDEENLRFILKEAFSKEYQVLTAAEGLSAVEIIKKESPLLVFLDMKMPGISGLEVLRLVKEASLSPVIWMLTGEEDLEIALAALKLGASGYLTKPFDLERIGEIIRDTVLVAEKNKEHKIPVDKPWNVMKKRPL